MSVMQQPSATGEYIIYRQRRGVELTMTLIACAFGVVGWVVSYLNLRGAPPDDLIPGTLVWFGMALAAHFVIRWRIPYADPVILPIVLATWRWKNTGRSETRVSRRSTRVFISWPSSAPGRPL